MSREIRRVPLDFDWPLDKVWEGYLRPDSLDSIPCQICLQDPGPFGRMFGARPHGDGLTPAARAVSNTFYSHKIDGPNARALAWADKIGQAEVDNLLAEGRLKTLVKREPTEDNPRDWEWVTLPRTADEVNAEQHQGGLGGHDSINQSILVRFRCETLGIQMECLGCEGHGSNEAYPGQRDEAEAWEGTGPPSGDGWQLWETVSEGSPVSPVFLDAEGLAQWLTTTEGGNASGPSRKPMSIEQARGFVAAGWAPTMIGNAGGLHDGASFVGTDAVLREHEENA